MPASNQAQVIAAWNTACAAHGAQPISSTDDLSTLTVGSKFASQAAFNAGMPGLYRDMKSALQPFSVPPVSKDWDDFLSEYIDQSNWYS